MLATLESAAIVGIEAHPVRVEVDVSFGLPAFTMVGLPDASVRESRDRVRSAIRNSGFEFPPHRVTVNLAPADLRKAGASFDLPIALGVLAASGAMTDVVPTRVIIVGELSLDGGIAPTRGVLPIALAARRDAALAMVLPTANAAEAAIVDGLKVVAVNALPDALDAVRAPERAQAFLPGPVNPLDIRPPDLADVRGQWLARRALEIAAAGGHHLLMSGPPGSGKTMLARRLPGILPPMPLDDAVETTAIYSVAGLMRPGHPLISNRPFRAPHHTASEMALLGGGSLPRPGEVSLAHRGVLFLDEAPEFERRALETLRQPLEEGEVRIARAGRTARFPARFQLVMAMNPCPCGALGHPKHPCRCTPRAIAGYQSRLSGPLRDRIDLFVDVPGVEIDVLAEGASPGEPTATVRTRVRAARERQTARAPEAGAPVNGQVQGEALRRVAALDVESRRLLAAAARRFGLSARVHDRMLRVARSIADLDGSETVRSHHLAEALQFRFPEPAQ